MPITPVGKVRSAGGLGSPYAPASYDRVNPDFGTEADLKRLVEQAHAKGMRVILDWVPNHTAWDHPWIAAHPDWYLRDAKGEISIPAGTNWQDVAALDYARPKMRAAMTAAMLGWVERAGIDGFRCDAADRMPLDFWSSAIGALRAASKRPLLMLAEGARPENYAAGFDLNYGWAFHYRLREAFAGKSAKAVGAAAAQERAEAPPGKAPLRFVTNHDVSAWEGTPLELYQTESGVTTALLLTYLSGGVPLVYTGQEAGYPKRIPIFERTTIPWDASPNSRKTITELLRLRREHPALSAGETTDLCTDDIVATLRRTPTEEALVVGSVRNADTVLPLSKEARGPWTDALTGARVTLGETLALKSYESRALVRPRR